ncbi:NACHT N-terminal helical domain 7-containing protein [Saccharothrix yanglingensis]|uniref:NACHT N-terminal Helical domain-containing protein n=1 Tax=Saccharothrix yanglingensis TaxID=659496 RepID=A0ABU0X4P3_9PSEU|nr:hypothetical protein [Saccharothrix yanglingensis]MDQ2587113.1 hypothetical protein [Saccharothrix yanglingensis]
MRSSLSYRDAVKPLGGDTGLAKLLDHASAATVLVTGGIDLLDARTEVVRVGRKVLSSVRERVTGLHRVDRTRLLEAAHGVLVVTSFFEALDEVGLPAGLKLDAGEQLVLAGADRATSKRDLVRVLLDTAIPLPSAEQPPEDISVQLWTFHTLTTHEVIDFLGGLRAWRALPEARRDKFDRTAEAEVPDRALAHYRARYRALALDCPEFAVWTSGIEHASTRAAVRAALADMRELLVSLTGSQPPDGRRVDLARGYRAALGRPIVDGEVPPGLVLPILRRCEPCSSD